MYQYIKIRNQLEKIYNERRQHRVNVTEIGISKPTGEATSIEAAKFLEYQPFKVGESFTGRDQYYWLKVEVQAPATFEGQTVLAYFDIGRTGLWFESGMEALLHIDDMPLQGVDRNHKEVLLHDFDLNWNCFYLQVWSGLEGGGQPKEQVHTFKEVSLALFDKDIDAYHLQMKHLFEALEALEDGHPLRGDYQKIILESYKLFQSEGAEQASSYIDEKLLALPKMNPVKMNCVAHTHIDLAWLWRIKHSKEKGRRSFYTMLKLIQDEDLVFFQSQPQLYEWIEQDDPELFSKIQEQVKKGNWEVGGGMWVEADLNLSSGESLVRQLLHGQRYLNDKFPGAVKKEFLWLPDVFGYNWSMPQLLRSAGIDYFFTTKMSWNEYNRMPHDTFKWKGIDGSEILCHFITTPHPYGDRHYVYNALVDTKSLNGTWENYHSKEWNKELLVAYGYGDGGGGANREMIQSVSLTNKIPTLPEVKVSRIDAYIDALENEIEDAAKPLPVWYDELYLQFHRGTYTVQGNIKKWNRFLENRYGACETMHCLEAAHRGGFREYHQEKLEKVLKTILTNQFHDILPGSSIREVNVDALEDFENAFNTIKKMEFEVNRRSGTRDKNAWTIYNPLQDKESRLVLLEGNPSGNSVEDALGRQLQTQQSAKGTWVLLDELKPYAFNNLHISSAKEVKEQNQQQAKVDMINGTLENNHYLIRWNTSGQILGIYDKELDRQIIQAGKLANQFQVFDDKPHGYEAWEIELDTLDDVVEAMEIIDDVKQIKLIDNGPLMTAIEFQYTYGDSRITQRMKVFSHTKRIDFETEMDWATKEKLVKVSFPLDVHTKEVACDIQFGHIKRPTHRTTKWDEAKFEICAMKWVDVSQRDYGVSLLNDGKYGHDVDGSCVRLSLLKSSIHPDTHADIGQQQFTYSLYPHRGDHLDGQTHIESLRLNNQLVPTQGIKSKLTKSLFDLQGEFVQIDAIKKAEDDDHYILRLHEYGGGSAAVDIRSCYDIESYCRCSILEEEVEEWTHTDVIKLSMKPFEIVTLKVKLKDLQEVRDGDKI